MIHFKLPLLVTAVGAACRSIKGGAMFVDTQQRPQEKLKLSEAIRIGAKIRPQSFSGYWGDGDGTSCVMGAAFEAVGIPYRSKGLDRARYFPSLTHVVAEEIFYRNDNLHQSREKISDWLKAQGL